MTMGSPDGGRAARQAAGQCEGSTPAAGTSVSSSTNGGGVIKVIPTINPPGGRFIIPDLSFDMGDEDDDDAAGTGSGSGMVSGTDDVFSLGPDSDCQISQADTSGSQDAILSGFLGVGDFRRPMSGGTSELTLPTLRLGGHTDVGLVPRRVSSENGSLAVLGSAPTPTRLTINHLSVPDDLGYNMNARRGSLSPSIRSENGSIGLNKPRKRLSSKYESLDYNVVESQRFLQEKQLTTPKNLQRASLIRWFVNFLIGAYVAVIAILVALLIHYISLAKFMAIYALIKDCDNVPCLIPPTLVWVIINVALVFLGSYLVTFHAPHAAGSGIPQIKCYLNGIKLPGLLSLKTLVAKAGGVVLAVCGGLACGKEGPMIHSGAICASGMSRAEFKCGKRKWAPRCCEPLRADEERRDFVAAGSASGVSAAFSSPIGGVLFSLEEGASFLKQMLTWRMLFSSMTASLLLNIMMSAIKGHPQNMSEPGLISLGYIGDIDYRTFEIPIFVLMALFGGLSGAAFIQLNYKITIFRRKYITKKWVKVFEACLVAACSAIILVFLIYAVPVCSPIRGFVPPSNSSEQLTINDTLHPDSHNVHRRSATASGGEHTKPHHESAVDGSTNNSDQLPDNHEGEPHGAQGHHGNPYGNHGHGYVFRGFCRYGEENRMAKVLFGTPEAGLHQMLHAPLDEFTFVPLIVLDLVYMMLATWTYGLMVSSGVFIPSLLCGAIWGRIFGMVVMKYIPSAGENISKYVLVGAACQLGGTVRMTISLTVIVIECTGDITFGIPIMLSLIVAKWMGDFFNPGIYDLHIEIMGIPLLPWEPPEMCYTVKAGEVMSCPVQVLRMRETIGHIAKLLDDDSAHNGFPVVEDYDAENPEKNPEGTFGRLKGFILKAQLKDIITDSSLLQESICELGNRWKNGSFKIVNGEIADEEMDAIIDLRMHMDLSPYSINEDVSLPRIFKLFRGVGLRHLVVTNDRNRVVGIISRINLARFREENVKGHFKLEELEISDT